MPLSGGSADAYQGNQSPDRRRHRGAGAVLRRTYGEQAERNNERCPGMALLPTHHSIGLRES
jgi:hypothetical protein